MFLDNHPHVFLQTVVFKLCAFLLLKALIVPTQFFFFCNSKRGMYRPSRGFKTPLRQSGLLVHEQAVCTPTVNSACENLQRNASKATQEKKCPKKLNKELLEKAVSASQERVLRDLTISAPLYHLLLSALPSK